MSLVEPRVALPVRDGRRPTLAVAVAKGVWLVVALVVALGCGEERPPMPKPPPAGESRAGEAAFYDPGQQTAVLTYAGERGVFADAQRIEDVPEPARGLVRLTLLDGTEPPPGRVWVANLREVGPDGRYRLQTVPRDAFEELALGTGRKSEVQLPEGLKPPVVLENEGVVVYKTDWCGVCKKLMSYLDRKGVKYQAKDVEKDPRAAAELQAKARKRGIATGSVPVIDVGGELIVGFDRARLEQLL